MRFAARWINYSLALIILCLTIYRAATLALTVDEATTYVGYVHHGWAGIFHGPFDANNHILYSILEKFTRQWFGMSELSLRLPALIGAALFLWSAARLCSALVPGVWFSLLSFLIVAINPLTLDLMAAARGYGLALGLLAFALLTFIEWLEGARWWKIPLTGLALGLSVAANLMFVFPAIATVCVGLLFIAKRQKYHLIPATLLLSVLPPVALWWAPFQGYYPDALYFGTKAIYDCIESMELVVFKHDLTRGDPFANWFSMFYLRWWILPFLIPILWCWAFVWLRRRATEGLAFMTLISGVACFGMWLAHVWLGILYPQERTGLAFIFLFLFTWTAAIGVWWHANRFTRWVLAFPSLLLALVFLFQFAGQFDPRYFGSWRLNWKMNEVMSRLRPVHGRLRTHWIYQSSAEYYRLRWKIDLQPIEREADTFPLQDAGYFLLTLETPEQITATGLRVLYRDEETGTTLLGK